MTQRKKDVLGLLKSIVYKQSERSAIFAIDELNYIDQDAPVALFEPNSSYFTVRLNEYFLRNSREFWKNYYPLAISLTQFNYNGGEEVVPYIIGPELLKSLNFEQGVEYANFRNVRLTGPTPYAGGDISLFLGLMRIENNNWSTQLLSFVETLSNSLSLNQLSLCLNIARPLVNSLERLMSMGQRIYPAESYTYSQPIGELTNGTLRPCTVAIIGKNENEVNPQEFWIKENRLFYGKNTKQIKPYTDSDYLLYSIEHQPCLEIGELSTMDFYQQHWLKVKELALKGQSGAAFQELTILLSSISTSPDITQSDQLGLLVAFPGLLNKYLAKYQEGLGGVFDALHKTQQTIDFGNQFFNSASSLSEKLNMGQGVASGIQEAKDYFVSQIANPTKSTDDDEAFLSQALRKGKDLQKKELSPHSLALGISLAKPI